MLIVWLSSEWPSRRLATSYPPGMASSQFITAKWRNRCAFISSPVSCHDALLDSRLDKLLGFTDIAAVATRKQPRRPFGAEFGRARRKMPINHAGDLAEVRIPGGAHS